MAKVTHDILNESITEVSSVNWLNHGYQKLEGMRKWNPDLFDEPTFIWDRVQTKTSESALVLRVIRTPMGTYKLANGEVVSDASSALLELEYVNNGYPGSFKDWEVLVLEPKEPANNQDTPVYVVMLSSTETSTEELQY